MEGSLKVAPVATIVSITNYFNNLPNMTYNLSKWTNERKSAASLYLQVTAWVSDMFCNFYSVKNNKTANNLTITKAWEKNKHRFGITKILGIFWCMFDSI